MEGKGSMVVRATSEGEDKFALLKNFTVAGSLVADRIKLKGLEAAAGAFSEASWDALAERIGSQVNEKAGQELAGASDEVEDLKASFEMKGDEIELENLSWKTKLYRADLSAEVEKDGGFEAEGSISVASAPSGKLISDPEARKKALDGKGRLIIPVKGSGKITDPRKYR